MLTTRPPKQHKILYHSINCITFIKDHARLTSLQYQSYDVMNNTGKEAPRPDTKKQSLNFTQGNAVLSLSACLIVQPSTTVTSDTDSHCNSSKP
jgi:hypothetical protein